MKLLKSCVRQTWTTVAAAFGRLQAFGQLLLAGCHEPVSAFCGRDKSAPVTWHCWKEHQGWQRTGATSATSVLHLPPPAPVAVVQPPPVIAPPQCNPCPRHWGGALIAGGWNTATGAGAGGVETEVAEIAPGQDAEELCSCFTAMRAEGYLSQTCSCSPSCYNSHTCVHGAGECSLTSIMQC